MDAILVPLVLWFLAGLVVGVVDRAAYDSRQPRLE